MQDSERLQRKFVEIASQYGCNAYERRCCPDKWFFVENMLESTDELPYQNIDHVNDDKACKIVFVLESPHIDEFKRAKGPAPANGPTGRFLRAFWRRIFEDRFCGYKIVLVNAIQYQCSLGTSPINHKIRDSVFQSLFANEDFYEGCKERLRKIVETGDVVLNACTKGKARTNRKENNKEMVRSLLKGYNMVEVPHPGSWIFRWRQVKKIISNAIT